MKTDQAPALDACLPRPGTGCHRIDPDPEGSAGAPRGPGGAVATGSARRWRTLVEAATRQLVLTARPCARTPRHQIVADGFGCHGVRLSCEFSPEHPCKQRRSAPEGGMGYQCLHLHRLGLPLRSLRSHPSKLSRRVHMTHDRCALTRRRLPSGGYPADPAARLIASRRSASAETSEGGFGASNGAGSRNRTRDLLITNQLLYQLSYAGASRGF